MRLTVVGCAGSFPSETSATSCYLLETDAFRLVVDLGSGALGPLQRYVRLDEVDAVLISHLHADHCLDLCGYYVARSYAPGGALPCIPVHGPPGTARRVCRGYDLNDHRAMDGVFDFHEVAEGSFEIGPFRVTAEPMKHPVAAFGYRLEADGAVLAYTGDTGEYEGVERIAQDADLLLAEASFVTGHDNPPDMHLTGRQAGVHATRAGVKHLVLTHLVPAWNDPSVTLAEAQETFSGPVELAEPGSVYHLPARG